MGTSIRLAWSVWALTFLIQPAFAADYQPALTGERYCKPGSANQNQQGCDYTNVYGETLLQVHRLALTGFYDSLVEYTSNGFLWLRAYSCSQPAYPVPGPNPEGTPWRYDHDNSPVSIVCFRSGTEPPSACPSGDMIPQLPFTGLASPSAPSSTCHEGCTYSIDPSSEICAGEAGGTFQCQADYESTGSTCNDDGGSDSGGDDEGGGDDDGSDDGGSDGGDDDGGDQGGGGDGSGDDGGGDGGGGDGTGDGGDQCDPETEDCQEGEYGPGVCEETKRTEPKCHSELDIVQCGIYLNNWNRRCDAIQHLTEVYGNADEIKSATDAGNSVLGDHKNNQISTDEVDFAGLVDDALDPGLITINSQCPAPLKFTFYGKSYELSWEPMCTVAEGVHPFVVTLGYVAAAFIMIKRIKK